MDSKPLGLKTWFRMARFVHLSNCISNEHLAEHGLTVAQFEALDVVRTRQPIAQNELAAALTISVGGVSRMLAQLERQGLIAREQQWKHKYISLTQAGEQKMQDIYPGQVELQTSFFEEALSPAEQQQLYELITRVYASARERNTP